MKLHRALSYILLAAFVPSHLLAGTPNHYVVANWIVPMQYAEHDDFNTILQNDVRAALELGLDGFALDAFSGQQAKDLLNAFITAADSVGASNFKVFLSADMSLQFTAEDIVDTIKTFGNNPHYLKINGKPLLSTFGGDELGDSWWREKVLSPLAKAGSAVTFIPYFDRPNPNWDPPSYEIWLKTIRSFPSSDGLFNFLLPGSTPFYSSDANIGRHLWSILEGEENLARALRDSGKLYIAPFTPYYWAVCHPVRQYMEHQGGRGMDNWWTSLVTKQSPDIVEIVTWNDYSESTFIQPTRITNTKAPGVESMPHLGYYELLKYYISWFHHGKKPTLTKDALFFFHRIHPNNAEAVDDKSGCALGPVSPSKKFGKIEDVIYVTTALTMPAELIVRIGKFRHEYNLPAGLSTIDVPFTAGTPNFELWRDGERRTWIDGHRIIERPVVYNFNVYSGYAIVYGQCSQTWKPSDKWKTGFVADWFIQQ
jgi:glucan endo-1,3-alpha-glucosidase